MSLGVVLLVSHSSRDAWHLSPSFHFRCTFNGSPEGLPALTQSMCSAWPPDDSGVVSVTHLITSKGFVQQILGNIFDIFSGVLMPLLTVSLSSFNCFIRSGCFLRFQIVVNTQRISSFSWGMSHMALPISRHSIDLQQRFSSLTNLWRNLLPVSSNANSKGGACKEWWKV